MISILFFAHLQDMVGHDRLTIEADGMTISDLKKKLMKEYQLKDLDQIMFAINEEYANDNDRLKTGDTIALIPPVSGG